MLIKYIFLVIGVILALLLIIRPVLTKILKDNMKVSFYVSCMAIVMFLYVFFAFLAVIFMPSYLTKAVMLVLGLSPFIVGKLVTYEKVLFYSIIQIVFVIAGICYTLLI